VRAGAAARRPGWPGRSAPGAIGGAWLSALPQTRLYRAPAGRCALSRPASQPGYPIAWAARPAALDRLPDVTTTA